MTKNQTQVKFKARRGDAMLRRMRGGSLFPLLTRHVGRRQLKDEDPSRSRGQSEESLPLAAQPRCGGDRIRCQAWHAGNHVVVGRISEVDFANICKHGLHLALCYRLLEEGNGREYKS